LEKAIALLFKEKAKYKKNYFKMWLCTVIGVIIGAILAPLTLEVWEFSGYSLYDRSGLDELTKVKLGNYTWNDILVDDLMITAYEYNSKQPRFYSKYFNRIDPGFYNLFIR
jgi:patatin-like phospholipase/acyl hydrolase